MNDVAIIGVGLHAFGRFEGKAAMEMATDAIQLALADAGLEWKDIQFAVGGSWTVANPDAIVGMVGLTGDSAGRLRDRDRGRQRAVEIRTRRYGAFEVNTTYAPVHEDVSPTVYAARAAFDKAGVAPGDVDVIQLQDTDAGAEVIHMAEAGFCADGEQEKPDLTAPRLAQRVPMHVRRQETFCA